MSLRLLVLPLLLLLAACEVLDRDEGRLSLSLTDAPVEDVDSVEVTVDAVILTHEDGDTETLELEPPQRVDLLQQRNGSRASLLSDVPVRSGRYDRIRLRLVESATSTESSVLPRGTTQRQPLFVPEDAEAGLILNGAFVVPDGEAAAFTIDLDLRQSLRTPAGGAQAWTLRPVLRIVEDARAGSVAGSVGTARATAAGCVPAVYAFAGRDTEPDDIDGLEAEPLTEATVERGADGVYRYQLAFLPAGDYSLAYTCGAGLDEPDSSQTLSFVRGLATVRAQATTTANF